MLLLALEVQLFRLNSNLLTRSIAKLSNQDSQLYENKSQITGTYFVYWLLAEGFLIPDGLSVAALNEELVFWIRPAPLARLRSRISNCRHTNVIVRGSEQRQSLMSCQLN